MLATLVCFFLMCLYGVYVFAACCSNFRLYRVLHVEFIIYGIIFACLSLSIVVVSSRFPMGSLG